MCVHTSAITVSHEQRRTTVEGSTPQKEEKRWRTCGKEGKKREGQDRHEIAKKLSICLRFRWLRFFCGMRRKSTWYSTSELCGGESVLVLDPGRSYEWLFVLGDENVRATSEGELLFQERFLDLLSRRCRRPAAVGDRARNRWLPWCSCGCSCSWRR